MLFHVYNYNPKDIFINLFLLNLLPDNKERLYYLNYLKQKTPM